MEKRGYENYLKQKSTYPARKIELKVIQCIYPSYLINVSSTIQ